MNRTLRPATRRGASAVELVLVVIILGLLAALAIPRFSRAGQSTVESAVRERLMVLRTAIDLYYRDHGVYPCGTQNRGEESDPADDGCEAVGMDESLATAAVQDCLTAQLTKYTSKKGDIGETRAGPFVFGPYLKHGVPASPLRVSRDEKTRILIMRGPTPPGYQPKFPQADWVYNCDSGDVAINSDQNDATGKRFDQY